MDVGCSHEDRGHGASRDIRRALCEERAQGTLEYAITVIALLSLILALGALWRAGEDGALVRLAESAAPRRLDGLGALDIALF